MKRRGYFYVALSTTLNIIGYALTLGRYLWLEGRVRGSVFRNWGRRYRYRPTNFVKPSTEEEIVGLARDLRGVRFFGAAHSFNNGVVADETLVSLDSYKGVLWKDLETMQVAFKGGTRIRECAKLLLDEGLAFGALPSHDAQSVAGIISTDVHGTGRDWGFVSDEVVSIKIIDGNGVVHECKPSDDLFKTAIGGDWSTGHHLGSSSPGRQAFQCRAESPDVEPCFRPEQFRQSICAERTSQPLHVSVHRPLPDQYLERDAEEQVVSGAAQGIS